MGYLIILVEIVLIVLKAAAVISWPWWVVLLPVILWAAMFLVALLFLGVLGGGAVWVASQVR